MSVRAACRVSGVVPRSRAVLAAAACVAAMSAMAFATSAAGLSADMTARILAGLESTAPAGVQLSDSALAEYARMASARWDEYERRTGRPMQQWSRAELGPARGATVFYPFAGPDYATVQRMYPDAGRYVLVALQRAEAPPALGTASADEVSAFMSRFGEAWKQFAQLGFFRTLDLDEEAKQTGLRAGITAPLIAFAARSGYTIVSVQPVRVRSDGTDLELHPGPRADPSTWNSVRISLQQGLRKVQLDYVRMNLSDATLSARPELRAWIERMAENRTVLKAASHLPQSPRFTIVRDAILERAPSILQDETGIEYSTLLKGFEVTLYGRFSKPHSLFNKEAQRALAHAYEIRRDVKPLSFRVSYQRQPEANLQLAVRSRLLPASQSR